MEQEEKEKEEKGKGCQHFQQYHILNRAPTICKNYKEFLVRYSSYTRSIFLPTEEVNMTSNHSRGVVGETETRKLARPSTLLRARDKPMGQTHTSHSN